MDNMLIGEVARRVGIAPSALRYYEKVGLLPKVSRPSGQRRYGPHALGRIRMIQIARRAGFTIAETRLFLSGFSTATAPAARWRALAERKLKELDAQVNRIAQMRAVLQSSFRCECLRIEDCERLMMPATKCRIKI